MLQEIIAAGLIIGDFVYHRWIDPPVYKPDPRGIQIPLTDDGTAIPLVYGRVRVRQAIVAWTSDPVFVAPDDIFIPNGTAGGVVSNQTALYFMNMLLGVGIPFYLGNQTLFQMWVGDVAMLMQVHDSTVTNLSDLQGNGGGFVSGFATAEDGDPTYVPPFTGPVVGPSCQRLAVVCMIVTVPGAGCSTFGAVEFLNGNIFQRLVDDASPYTPRTEAGYYMTVTAGSPLPPVECWNGTLDPSLIPGYRGLMCVFLYGKESPSQTLRHWCIGASPTVPAYSFEVSSYPQTPLGPSAMIGAEANPADVIFDLLTSPIGKLGIDSSRIDVAGTFTAVANTLAAEGMGYSRAFDANATAADMINEILVQIDGTIYEDPVDGLIKLKLVRADYDPLAAPAITTDNCIELQSFALGGWTDIPNKVRIVYPDRQDDYRDGSATGHSLANAAAQDGETREVVLRMPGVTTQNLAAQIADRELDARSKPLMKVRAIVDRTFYTTVPGDVVRVYWPEYGIAGVVFRVAAVNRGTLEDGRITLDLIQDFFYVYRLRPPVAGGILSFGGLLSH